MTENKIDGATEKNSSGFEHVLVEIPEKIATPDQEEDIPAALDFEIMASGGQSTVASAVPKNERNSDVY